MAVLSGPDGFDTGAPTGGRPAVDEPVTVLYSRRVKPGREADFEAWAHGIVAASRQFPGHLGASVLDAPGSREYHILFSFADRKSLRAWLDSDERRRWLARGRGADRGRPGAAAADRPGDLVPAARLECANDEATAPLEDVARLDHRRVPAGAGLPSPCRA